MEVAIDGVPVPPEQLNFENSGPSSGPASLRPLARHIKITVSRSKAASWGLWLIWRAIVGVILGRTVDVYIEW